MPKAPQLLVFGVLTAVGALLAWVMVGTGLANYDTAYSLVWGGDLAHGRLPDYDVPVAPTPHPLATLLGLVLAPLGAGAETAVVVAAFAFLGALAALTYLLGAHWFGPPAGAVAAVVILTREPVLSFGVRAYVDLPYLVLVLAALLIEARRPRAGVPVLLALGLAGLLRPEAWLLSAAYVAYLGLSGERILAPALVAAAAPLLWALSDLAIAGDPLFSLTDTRAGAEVLQRTTGLANVPLTVPRRLGEIVREPVLAGAAAGGVLAVGLARDRIRLPLAAGVLALGAFCVLAAAGLPILGRYLLLPATLLAIACGAGAFGWTLLAPGHAWRRRWQAIGVLVVLALLAFTPRQVQRVERLRGAIGIQREIRDDLHALAGRPPLRSGCRPVTVPNHRPVPLLALWLQRPPREIVSAQLQRPGRGVFVDPATPRVERNFTLDPKDPGVLTAEVPSGFARAAQNPSWVIYARC
ncbi:MAG TPA: hypothetical protein VES79_03485 [Solirubrobacteraceae bacterium]|nr:hypothetical protein [Solirubrobacteraceae bacterium]